MVASVGSRGITVASPARMGAMTATKTIVGSAGGLETGSRGAGVQTMGREKGFSSQKFASFNSPAKRVFSEHGQRANFAMTPSVRARETSPLINIHASADKQVARINRNPEQQSPFSKMSEQANKRKLSLGAHPVSHRKEAAIGNNTEQIHKIAPIRQEGSTFYIGKPEARPGVDTNDALKHTQIIAKNTKSAKPEVRILTVDTGKINKAPDSKNFNILSTSRTVESVVAKRERIARTPGKKVVVDTALNSAVQIHKKVAPNTPEAGTSLHRVSKRTAEQLPVHTLNENREVVLGQLSKDTVIRQQIRERIGAIMLSQQQDEKMKGTETANFSKTTTESSVVKSLEEYIKQPKEQRILTSTVILGFAERVKKTATKEQLTYIRSLAPATDMSQIVTELTDESEVQKQVKKRLVELLQTQPEVRDRLMGELKQVIQTYISATSIERFTQLSVTTILIRQVVTHFERKVEKELQKVDPSVVKQLQLEKVAAPTAPEVYSEVEEEEAAPAVSKKEKKEKTPEFVEAEREMAARKKQIIGLALMKAVPESADFIVHGDEVVKEVIQTVDVTSPIIKDKLSKEQIPDGAFEDSIKEIEKIRGPIPYFILESNRVINRNPSVDVSVEGKVVTIEDVRRVHKKISTHNFYENAWKQIAA